MQTCVRLLPSAFMLRALRSRSQFIDYRVNTSVKSGHLLEETRKLSAT
jgi:hypothetical protein